MRRILLVDAAPAALAQLQQALRHQRAQWDTVAAASGAAAMASLAQDRFDAIVSDIGMPAMDGAQLLAQCATAIRMWCGCACRTRPMVRPSCALCRSRISS